MSMSIEICPKRKGKNNTSSGSNCGRRDGRHTESFVDGWSRETSNKACAGPHQSKAGKSVNVISNITCGKHSNITEFIANDTLTCIYTNIDGLNCIKGSELNIVIQQESPDIVFVTETKLSAKCIVTQYVDCAEYNIFRKDRDTGLGGGILIMVKNKLYVTQLFNDSWKDVEAVVCQLRIGRNLINLACMYRPPDSPSSYNAGVRQSIQAISSMYQGQTLICGDFNFKEIN